VAFIDIPAEQTTALTDAVLALIALYAGIALQRFRNRDPAKVRIWSWTFGLLAVIAGLQKQLCSSGKPGTL
jgi:hypothetical protein